MPDNPQDARLEHELEAWAAAQTPAEISPDAERKIQQALSGGLERVRPIQPPGRLAAGFLLVFVFAGIALIAMQDKAGFRLMSMEQIAGITAVGFAGAVLFSLSLAWQMIPGARRFFSVPVALISGAAMLAGFALLFPWRFAQAFAAEGWRCSVMELMVAVPAAVVFWLLARRGALVGGAGLGATLGGLAVLLALTVVQFQCMYPQAPHLLVWHGGVAALLIGSGALLGHWRKHRQL